VAAVFGVLWLSVLSSMGPPGPISRLFHAMGVLFVLAGIGSAIYNLYNATSRNRFSSLDVTTDREESDPIAEALDLHPDRGRKHRGPEPSSRGPRRVEGGYCPYCGAAVDDDFDFCPKCGKDI